MSNTPAASPGAAPEFHVVAFYKFTPLDDIAELQGPLLGVCKAGGVYGTILLAPEGINGTIAGPKESVYDALDHIRSEISGPDLEFKESTASENPFYRMKVRLKKEIVTMGVPEIDPNKLVGTYVAPSDWNELISDPDVVVIDTRNEYEVRIGTFDGAIDPGTASFRDFPKWFEGRGDLAPNQLQGKKVAMFCTGGIRCEKATAFVKEQGIEDVYHLKGGILKYLEEVPQHDSLWKGECFVFDQRVSVDHDLKPGNYELCRSCRHPIDEEIKASPEFEEGVSCPNCYNPTDEARRSRMLERQHQMALAEERGEVHLGRVFDDAAAALKNLEEW